MLRLVIGVDDLVVFDHDAAMREAASDAPDNHVAGKRRPLHFPAESGDDGEEALFVPMQMPLRRIGPRIERRHEAGIDRAAHQQHRAIDGAVLSPHIALIAKRGAQP